MGRLPAWPIGANAGDHRAQLGFRAGNLDSKPGGGGVGEQDTHVDPQALVLRRGQELGEIAPSPGHSIT
jgi:hypothetical protein